MTTLADLDELTQAQHGVLLGSSQQSIQHITQTLSFISSQLQQLLNNPPPTPVQRREPWLPNVSSLNAFHSQKRSMGSVTGSYWRENWCWQNEDTGSRGQRSGFSSGWTRRIWNVFNQPNVWAPAKPGGHYSFLVSTSTYLADLETRTPNMMPFLVSSFPSQMIPQVQPYCRHHVLLGQPY